MAAEARLSGAGLETTGVDDTVCCYAEKTETWVHGPDGTRWEWYVKHGDTEQLQNVVVGTRPDRVEAVAAPVERMSDGTPAPHLLPGGSDPDQQRRWWSSATAQPIGTVGTNFGRFVDEVIDENLDIIRTNPDPDARREAAETINRRFGEQVYDLWLNYALWGVITSPQVKAGAQRAARGRRGTGRVLRWPALDPADLVRRRRLRLNRTAAERSRPGS